MTLAALSAGLLAAISLPLGAAVALLLAPSKRIVAVLMAFGVGALLSALSIEFVARALHDAGFVPLAGGCLLGGLLFVAVDRALDTRGGFLRKAATAASHIERLKKQNSEVVQSRLAQLSMLELAPPEEIAGIVPLFDVQQLPADKTLCSEGDPADALYIIDEGEVEVSRAGKSGQERVAVLKVGDMFGEMELLHGRRRAATVRSTSPVRLLRLHKRDFETMLWASKTAREKIRELAVARSEDLETRALVSIDEAWLWRGDAEDLVKNAIIAPAAADVRNASRSHGAVLLGISLGVVLDTLPESLAVGTSTESFATLPWALVAGIFLANLPEAMSSSLIMRVQELGRGRIVAMWLSTALAAAAVAWLGAALATALPAAGMGVVEGAAAGAMLTMMAHTMLPEAYEKGGALAGLSTLLGFLAVLAVKALL